MASSPYATPYDGDNTPLQSTADTKNSSRLADPTPCHIHPDISSNPDQEIRIQVLICARYGQHRRDELCWGAEVPLVYEIHYNIFVEPWQIQICNLSGTLTD